MILLIFRAPDLIKILRILLSHLLGPFAPEFHHLSQIGLMLDLLVFVPVPLEFLHRVLGCKVYLKVSLHFFNVLFVEILVYHLVVFLSRHLLPHFWLRDNPLFLVIGLMGKVLNLFTPLD